MTPERWQRLKSLFQAAVEMPQHKRSSFVAQACGRDSELRRQLASLVDAHARETRPDIDPIVRLREVFRFDAPQFSEGEVLLGRFQIVRLLGSGGMGDVYEANDLELGRIALKTIRPDVAGDPQILSRFKTEVQLARRISDRHVCRIYEMFVVPDRLKSQSTVFLTMEFLDGITLAERIQKSGSLPWLEARSLALQLCAGLRAIHGAGVIHRDFKTRNVMLAGQNGSERAVVMDFGLARLTHYPPRFVR